MKHIFSKKQTDLDLNGPNLSFTTQPSSITGIGTTVGGSQGANVSITGVSTSNFNYGGDDEESSTPINNGEIKYQWYEEDVGKLSDDSSTTGTGTTTLTISNLITPTDNGRKFFLTADYEPLTPVLTGNAPNEPLNSGIATVTVTPLVQITTQPAFTSTFPNVATNISVIASLSDSSFGDDTQYQWQLDGSDVSDGTITKTTSSSGTFYANGTTIDGFNGVGQYRIYYNEGIEQTNWNAGTGPNSTGSTFAGTEAETIVKAAAEISSKVGLAVVVGSLQETLIVNGDTVRYYSIKTVAGVVTTIVAGATTPTLTLTSDNFGIGYVARCVVSSANVSNSPIVSDSQIYTVESLADFNNIKIESIPNGLPGYNSGHAVLSSIDLSNGQLTINAATTSTFSDYFLYSLYSPDKDIPVEMELYGGKGVDLPSGDGGRGGFSRIRFTMKQNEEYVIAGLTPEVNTPFVYHKGSLIACVGGGGGAGSKGHGHGGDGGGVGVGGATGVGPHPGVGGNAIATGTLGANGIFGSSYIAPTLYPGDTQAGDGFGGQTIKCPKGVYYAQKGVGPCVDVGVNGDAGFIAYFRLSDGTIVNNTALIDRGYKAGYNIIQTGGKWTNSQNALGGSGATGGGAGFSDSASGGGSGYTDGSLTEVVYTQQGGSTGDAKIILRVVN